MTARAVHWHEGMFLRPQQFQAAERFAHEIQARLGRWDVQHYWGARRVEWEPEALATYRFALRALEVRLRDGSALILPDDGSLPALDLKPAFQSTNRVTIFLAVPQLRLGRANAGAVESSRYRTDMQDLEDENTGVNPQPVSVLLPNVRLLTDADEHAGFDVIPLARLEKSARAEAVPQLDTAYIPPVLACDAWPPLQVGILRTIYDRIGKKIELLASQVVTRGITLDSHGQGDGRIVGQLSRLNEAHALLGNMAFVEGIHPLPAYLELCRLVGQLSIFGKSARPPQLPRYDHDDLGGCFYKVKQYIDGLLNEVEEPSYEERAFIGAGLRMQVSLEPGWLEPAWSMFLGVRSPLGGEDIVRLLTKAGQLDMKVGSSDRVDAIFTKGAAGLKFTPSPRPPRSLPSAPDLTYFQIDRDSTPAEWQFVAKSLSLAIRFNEKLIEGNIQGERELKLKVKTGGGQTATLQVTLYVVPQSLVDK
jgi:type VI secretion system protein ImpJ